jgi:hypothetical protein
VLLFEEGIISVCRILCEEGIISEWEYFFIAKMAINMGIIPEIKLNGKKYNDWVHKIEPLLTMRKQYDLVSGKETPPTEQKALEKWDKYKYK